MPEEEQAMEVYRERISKVESQVEIVAVRQMQMQSVIDRQTALIERVAAQITASDLVVAAIRERTDQHSKTIERLQEKESDVSNILESMKAQMSIVRLVGSTAVVVVVGWLFSLFIK